MCSTKSVGSTTIYGPLAAPIAFLLWLYVISIAVLIGAALNSASTRSFPSSPESTTMTPDIDKPSGDATEAKRAEPNACRRMGAYVAGNLNNWTAFSHFGKRFDSIMATSGVLGPCASLLDLCVRG